MNRLKKAWLALTDRLEPEVRVEKVVEQQDVYGDAIKVTLFRADDPRKELWDRAVAFAVPVDYEPAAWHGSHFATCAQAFAECPGANVVEVNVWRVGDAYYQTPRLSRIKVQPKPKRPKGSRA